MWNTKAVAWGNSKVLVKSFLWIFFTCVPSLRLKIGQAKHLDSQPIILFGPILPRTPFHDTLDPQPHPGSGARLQGGQRDNMPRIISATKKGKFNAVSEEICKGVDVDTVDSEGATSLYWSSCSGNASLSRFLIQKGANVNHKVNWESTPLHAAADRGRTECVECLLISKADVNAQNANHDTPLHLAAYRGYYQICLLLLAYNASLNLKNFKGKTPCQEAMEAGHTKIVKILANNNKGGTFPLENKTIGDVYRNKFSAENGERGDVQYSYERQLSDQQYSERTPDISLSTPILMAQATCGNSGGHHSFPNLNLLTSFSTNFKENSPQSYNQTITKLNSYNGSKSPCSSHPAMDSTVLFHLNRCSPVPSQRPLYIQGSNHEIYSKTENLELKLATAESVRSALEEENILLRRENLSLKGELSSCKSRMAQNNEQHVSGHRPDEVNMAQRVMITELKEELKSERYLRLAAESRSRQAARDMFLLRGRLDDLVSSAGHIPGKSLTSD